MWPELSEGEGGWRVEDGEGREGGTSSKGLRALVSLGVSFLVVWGATEGPSVLTGEALWMMSREWGTEPWVRGERETECQAPAVF